jgi:hypothetical protein
MKNIAGSAKEKRMVNERRRLRDIEERKKATDDELREAYMSGMFLNQIRKKYKTGMVRLRKIARACDEEMKKK